jgi:DNA-binding NtrC family response regulator
VLVELIADRFIVHEGRAIDLGSGDEVVMVISSAGGAAEQLRWALRCQRLARLHHPSLARLLDFGMLGEARRFEAWRASGVWNGSRLLAVHALRQANALLQANYTTITAAARVHTWNAHPAVVLDSASGFDTAPGQGDVGRFVPPAVFALEHMPRAAVETIGELLIDPTRIEPCAIALWGVRGAGLRTATRDIARVARLSGVVPLAASMDRPDVRVLLAHRTVLIIDDGTTGDGWRRLLESGLGAPRQHLLLLVGRKEVARVHNLRLDPLPRELLLGAVRPHPLSACHRPAVTRCAAGARGWPGRFATLLRTIEPQPRGVSVAAERRSRYVIDRPATVAVAEPRVSSEWPVDGDVAAHRRRLTDAVAQLGSGRRAAAVRAVRGLACALARRHDWRTAANGMIALAATLVGRGQLREASAALDEAGQFARSGGGDESPVIDIAILAGRIRIEQTALVEGETLLREALAAARAREDHERVAASLLGLVRALFWQGRFDEAMQPLEALGRLPASDHLAVRTAQWAARLAAGRREPGAGVAVAVDGLAIAERLGDPRLIAHASQAAAFAHLAIGDHAAVRGDIERSVAAAKAGRDPLCALRARLLAAESDRRQGRSGAAAAMLTRLSRVSASCPEIVRARIALLRDLLTPAETTVVVERHVSITGLQALRLFAPGYLNGDAAARRVGLDDALAVLTICQSVEEEGAALSAVCARVRRGLHAAAVAFVVPRGGGTATPASDGGKIDASLAGRAHAIDDPMPPHPYGDGVAAYTPVRYGGRTIGTIVVRWLAGSAVDAVKASTVLTMAAAAAGPSLASVCGRLGAAARLPDQILGVSGVMADVRHAVDRAATAPFPVLVEGESGCGKELVARALHKQSLRRERAFCAVNCAALPDDLVEAELFGHTRGAFTGAVSDRPGVFEEAHGGTLFLDEVGELPLRAQAKVLRTIQEGELRRIGENTSRRIDVRIVSATNRDLRREAAAGRFRLDLLYRLDVIRIAVPPLRERSEDIALLIEHFWHDAVTRVGSRAVLGMSTVAALSRHSWPGNVRELQNVLAALAVRSPRRGVVPPAALPPNIAGPTAVDTLKLDEARRSFEERFVRAALVRTGGHRGRAAEELGVSRQGLTKLLSRLGIAAEAGL